MAEVKIKQFAEQIRIDPERLLEQLAAAGVTASSVDDSLSEEDKKKLLGYLKGERSAEPAKAKSRITLKRKTTSEIKQTSKTGAARTVHVARRSGSLRGDPGAPAGQAGLPPEAAGPQHDPGHRKTRSCLGLPACRTLHASVTR